jgi:dTDP-4-amino-4,6-dideoxygalactose transaminase
MAIEFYNLQQLYDEQKFDIMKAIHQVAVDGQYFANESVVKFESLISRLYNQASVVATNSGTSALITALYAANIPVNSFVIIPAMTYVATANAVRAVGCIPLPLDIDDQWLLDYDLLAEYLSIANKKISAVIVVDLYGQGVDLVRFKELCDNYSVKLIVDAAQSFEMHYHNYNQIDYCDSLALSFNPLKNLGAMGNAGAVVSKNHSVEELSTYVKQGLLKTDAIFPGLNMRMDAVQAAVLNVKFTRFYDHLIRKCDISDYYRQHLFDLVEMPKKSNACTHTNYVFPIAPKNADKVRAALDEAEIGYASHYLKPIHHHSAFKDTSGKDFCPNATKLATRIISIPNHNHLSNNEVDYIISLLKSVI